MKLAPIVLFVFNRLEHTRQTVEALKNNELVKSSVLYIYSDGPKNKGDEVKIKKIREYLKTINGFKEINITERKKNLGLDPSVIKGVTEVINKHGKVIVLEDDIITSKAFLYYANFLLKKCENEKKVYSITGYNHPKKLMKMPKNYKYDTYFNPRAGAQIWATWKDRWENVDWDIKDFNIFLKSKKLQKKFNAGGVDMSDLLIRSQLKDIKFGNPWDIRWCYHHFKYNAYCIYPIKSYINNIGYDNTGVHSGTSNKFNINTLNEKKDLNIPKEIVLNDEIMNNFRKVYKPNYFKKYLAIITKRMGLYNFLKRMTK